MTDETDAIERLEEWLAGDKGRACGMGREDGYAAGCWQVTLSSARKKRVVDCVEIPLTAADVDGGNFVVVEPNPDADEPGLARTIHAALDRWDKLYGKGA